MQDAPDSGLSQPGAPDSDPLSHRHRKKKVKRKVRIKRKAVYITALAIAWLLVFGVWYYVTNRPDAPPPS
jgi:hypothetical protein